MEHSFIMPLIYYTSGIFSGILLLALSGKKTPLKLPMKKKGWSKITNLDYTYDVDHEFKQKQSGQQIAYTMAEVMKLKIEKEPGGLENIVLDPAHYSIHMETYIRFVERGESKAENE